MKLVTYAGEGNVTGVGLVTPGGQIVDLARAMEWAVPSAASGVRASLPTTMIGLLQAGPAVLDAARAVSARLVAQDERTLAALALPGTTRLLAPITRPNNLRDFYAFEMAGLGFDALGGALKIEERAAAGRTGNKLRLG